MWWLLIIPVVVLFSLWMWRISERHTQWLFTDAQKAEEAGDYRNALLLYAEALANYYKPPEICRERIRELWEANGPFEYSAELAEFDSRTDCDREGDLELFKETLSIIQQVIAGKTEKRSWENEDG